MIEIAVLLLVSLLVLLGSLFALTASIGLLCLPDFLARTHAASKAGTVGSGLLLLAAGLQSGSLAIFLQALATGLFFVLTAPVAAHLLARAAIAAAEPPADNQHRDI